MTDLTGLDLVTMAEAIRHGEITSEAATRWSLARLREYGSALNAVMQLDEDSSLEAARQADRARASGRLRGPLHGVPLAHKDLFYRAGRVCTGGSVIRKDFVPDVTASVLNRLDAAGALDLGTLHMSEFALSPTGFNVHYGPARNPWSPSHVPGGSSSGSGIAVAARLVTGALGTDTGGSIRHPAAMCGVTGLKPTLRRVTIAGVMPLAYSLDCVGPLAQSARDCARLLGIVAGADPTDATAADLAVPDYEAALTTPVKGLRIAVPQTYYLDPVTGDVRAALDESLRVFRELGATVVPTETPDMTVINAMMQVIMACEAAAIHRRWLRERPEDYAAQVRSRIEPGLYYPATRYIEALSLRARLTERYLAIAMRDCDAIHLPAIPVPVPTIEATTRGSPADVASAIGAVTHCTRAINYLGLPALSVPAGFSADGLPVAFQLVGRPFAESMVLRIGHAYQVATDWHRRVPPAADRATGARN